MLSFLVAGLLFSAATPKDESREKLFQSFEQGDVAAARKIACGLIAGKKHSGGNEARFAIDCANAAFVEDYAGDYAQAESLYLNALKIIEQTSGAESAETSATLHNLFALYVDTGSAAKADEIARLHPPVRDENVPSPHGTSLLAWTGRGADWVKARAALAEGWIDYLHGETDAALIQATSAREISQKVEARPGLSDAVNLIATVHYKRGEYDEALKIYTEALAISSACDYKFGNARNWSSLGSTSFRQGDYRVAFEDYEKSLEARRALGNNDEIARALSDLANVHHEMGAYERALALRQQALSLWKKTGNIPGMADALNDIAWDYQAMGEDAKAFSDLEQARELHEKAADRWGVADDLDGIGLAHFKMAEYDAALEAFRDSLGRFSDLGSLEERARVELHVGETLHTLDRLGEAEAAFQTALALYEKAFGANSPRNTETLERLARVAIDAGRQSDAIVLARRDVTAAEVSLGNILSFTSERQRLEFQKTTDPYSLLATLGQAPELAETVLRNKGIVLDSLLEDRLVAEASNDPREHERVARLRTAKQRLVQLSLEAPTAGSPDALKKREAEKKALTTEVDELEAGLAREVAGLGRARRALRVTVGQVQSALAPDESLIEMVRYEHYLGKTKSEPRYGAILITPAAEPKWIALGPAAEIEKNIRVSQRCARGETSEATCGLVLRALDRELWAPIEQALPQNTRTVIISPDGVLSFLSFATLVEADDRFLSEKYAIRYVASGRDLLRQNTAAASEEMDVYADPDFGKKNSAPGSRAGRAVVASRSATTRDWRQISLAPLPGTAREAAGLQKHTHERIKIFRGPEASERELRRIQSPRVLHLATHGFFLPEIEFNQKTNGGIPLRDEIPKGKLVNPMFRSGIALAKAQSTLTAWSRGEVPPTEDDGIVTAEEVGGLHLEGTDLVVLSACETGSGEARAGEGVMGLRRGFVQAGAKNLLMTLWPISDDTTVQIMFDFYDAALKTGNAPQALADTQRDWLVKLRREKGLLAAVRLAGPFIMSSQGKP